MEMELYSTLLNLVIVLSVILWRLVQLCVDT